MGWSELVLWLVGSRSMLSEGMLCYEARERPSSSVERDVSRAT